jgi:hypothetical protein
MDGELAFDGKGAEVFAALAEEVYVLAERAPVAAVAA